MVIEIGVFHNGASDLPTLRTKSGVVVNKGNLDVVNESLQRVQVNQVRQGILADRLGFDYFFMTEHHFQPEGAEFSPNPLLSETAIAVHTKRIRLGQTANILPWWHPVRIAEQAAMLDVISGGRLEFGIGRGYQPRENEVFGWAYGSTIQDQERNRSYYHEAYELIMKCWTQPSFQHRGEFFSTPPSYTKWNHKQTIAYFGEQEVGRKLEDVLKIGPPDAYSAGNPVLATTTTMKELQVFPRPLQKPHPQVWEPLTTERSIRWAAQKGVNGYFIVEPNSRLKANVEMYYEEAEKQQWPDRLNRGKLKYGWDADKHRGIMTGRYIHIYRPGKEAEERKRVDDAISLQWDYYGPFGFTGVLSEAGEPMYPLDMVVTGDFMRKKEILIDGTAAEVIEKLMRIKETVGYDDFMFNAWFELGGFSGAEIEEQMQIFAAEVMPALRKACGGGPNLPLSTANYDVGVATPA